MKLRLHYTSASASSLLARQTAMSSVELKEVELTDHSGPLLTEKPKEVETKSKAKDGKAVTKDDLRAAYQTVSPCVARADPGLALVVIV